MTLTDNKGYIEFASNFPGKYCVWIITVPKGNMVNATLSFAPDNRFEQACRSGKVNNNWPIALEVWNSTDV